MKLLPTLLTAIGVIGALSLSPPAAAKANINDMQGCQALLEFIDFKMESAPKRYAPADVAAVRKGMAAYDGYIQSEIITPGLLDYAAGNVKKAADLQKQVDAYKKTVIASYKARYPQDRVFADQAVSVNNCAKMAVPAGQDLEALKTGLQTLLKLARQN